VEQKKNNIIKKRENSMEAGPLPIAILIARTQKGRVSVVVRV
jgi:hypothetical protein